MSGTTSDEERGRGWRQTQVKEETPLCTACRLRAQGGDGTRPKTQALTSLSRLSQVPEAHNRTLATPDAGHTGQAARLTLLESLHGNDAIPAAHQHLTAEAAHCPPASKEEAKPDRHGHLSSRVSSFLLQTTAVTKAPPRSL